MRGRLFVDTSAWIALTNEDDQNHALAQRFYESDCKSGTRRLITTDFILSETLTFLRYRFGVHIAEKFWMAYNQAVHNGLVELFSIDEETFSEAIDLFFKYRDQKFSVVDCTSFALIQKLGIEAVSAFDRDFLIMGFVVEPV